MLGNAHFDTFFANKVISNCDVLIYANEGDLLLDKEHITNFTMSRENECAVSFAPSDTAVVEIIKWDTLSANTKYFLSRPTSHDFQNFLMIYFKVNGESTTHGIVFAIEKVEINTKKWRAKLTLCSPFNMQSSPTSNWVLQNNFSAFPNNVTIFEAIQNTAVNLAKGLVIPNYQDYYWGDFSYVDVNREDIDVVYNDINMLEDAVESEDDKDRSDIEFVGIRQKESQEIHNQVKLPTQGSLSFDPFDFEGKSYVISNVSVHVTHSGVDVTSQFNITIYNDHIVCSSKAGETLGDTNYSLIVTGYEAELEQPTTDNYVKSYTWVSGSAGLLDAQTKTREYYSHKKYIEFDCRLDPRIEPLDNVFIFGIGLIKVEKVSMQFNGGFKGSIKGRLIRGMKLASPVVNDVGWYPHDDPTSFHFNITNNNPVDVVVTIIASDGAHSYDFTIGAFSTKTITQMIAPSLMESFVEKAGGSLQEEVYCYFYADEFEDSDNTIVLEAD